MITKDEAFRTVEWTAMDKKAKNKLTWRSVKDWLKVLVLLLDEAAVLVLVIIILRFFEIQIPLPVTIVIVLLLGIVVFITHKAVISSFHRRTVTGSEGMIGTQGQVVEPLKPRGAIMVNGERWKAISTGDDIDIHQDVEIVGIEGLTLKVKRKAAD